MNKVELIGLIILGVIFLMYVVVTVIAIRKNIDWYYHFLIGAGAILAIQTNVMICKLIGY